MTVIPVNLAIEDALSEAVLRRLLDNVDRGYAIGTAYGRNGYGYLRRTIHGWNRAARGVPFVVLTDLDTHLCPPALIREWLTEPRSANLLLRVAVREVESWLLADRINLAGFLNISVKKIPIAVDSLSDPKAVLVDLARNSRSGVVRSGIAPRKGSTAKQGADYNVLLSTFVRSSWDIGAARLNSPSLARTVERLRTFTPTW